MLRSAAASIAQAAGWITPAPDAAGVITFRLAEGLRLALFSPDGRSIILCSTVCALPADTGKADALVEKALRHAAAGGHRRSIISVSPGARPAAKVADGGGATAVAGSISETAKESRKLLLHRVLQNVAQTIHKDEFFAAEAEGLLNDLAWWRARLVDEAQCSDPNRGFDSGLAAFPSLGFPVHYSGGPLR